MRANTTQGKKRICAAKFTNQRHKIVKTIDKAGTSVSIQFYLTQDFFHDKKDSVNCLTFKIPVQ